MSPANQSIHINIHGNLGWTKERYAVTSCDMADHFMGSVTVGERGQVVIPAEARERLDIKSGDKLLVFIHPSNSGATFVKLDKMQGALTELRRMVEQMANLDAQSSGASGHEGEAE
jgi:AbrB family looped-hinge helix DNA binding protein